MSDHLPLTSKCCCCKKNLSTKCFLMSCNHLMCDRCSEDEEHYYRCEIDDRCVEAHTLAFYDESINKVSRIDEFAAFSINGTCGKRRCKGEALADIKICGHKLCASCMEKLVDNSARLMSLYIRCGIGGCPTEVPLVFAEGILGRCPIKAEQNKHRHALLATRDVPCTNQLDRTSGIVCSNESDIYSPGCPFNICYICIGKYIDENRTTIYLKHNLLDVVPCIRDNCSAICEVKNIQELASQKQQEYDKNVMSLIDPMGPRQYCWFRSCKNKARILFSCDHLMCRSCYLKHKIELEVVSFGKLTYYSICYVCAKRTKECTVKSLSEVDENDFFGVPRHRCKIFGHRESVASTYCCNVSYCQDCLLEQLVGPGISRSLFGERFDDVIECRNMCRGGVPKQMILQFLKKINGGKLPESTNSSFLEIQTSKPKRLDVSYQSKKGNSNCSNPNGSLDSQRNGTEKVGTGTESHTNQHGSSNTQANGNNNLEEEMPEDDSSNNRKFRVNDKGSNITQIHISNESNVSHPMETDDRNNLQSSETIDTPGHDEQQLTTERQKNRDQMIFTSCEGIFEGLKKMRPATDSTPCKCQKEAYVKLNCKHALCLRCLSLSECCNQCGEPISESDYNELMKRWTKIMEHQSKEEASGKDNRAEQVHISMDEDSAKGQTHTSSEHSSRAEQKQTSSKGNQGTVYQTEYAWTTEMKGVNNMGMTCYANSIFQILGQTDKFINDLTNAYLTAYQEGRELLLTHDLMVFLNQLNNTGTDLTVDKSILVNLLKRIVSIDSTFERYEQNDCFEFLMCILQRLKCENEKLTSMFELTMQTVLTFKPCKHVQLGQKQLAHSLLIPKIKDKNSKYTVQAGLDGLLSSSEKFGKGVLPCKICNIPNRTKVTEQSLELTDVPSILIVQIGRVNVHKGFFSSYARKENDFVKYTEAIEVSQLIEGNLKTTKQIHKYTLYGVVLHSGSIDSGHYYSYVKKLQTGQWFLCNDSLVMPIEKDNVFGNCNAYLLFYEKVNIRQLQTSIE